MKYIGLDCHKQYDHATMIDTETGEIKAKRLPHIKEEFKEFIGDRAGQAAQGTGAGKLSLEEAGSRLIP